MNNNPPTLPPNCPNCKIEMQFLNYIKGYWTDEYPESKCYWKCEKCGKTWEDEFVPALHKLRLLEK